MTDTKNTVDPSPQDTFTELRGMVTQYAKQETVEPLKQLGTWAAWGLAGAICLSVGGFFIALGLLRFTQTEIGDGWTNGAESLLPYAIAIGVLVIGIGLAAWGMKRRPADLGGTSS